MLPVGAEHNAYSCANIRTVLVDQARDIAKLVKAIAIPLVHARPLNTTTGGKCRSAIAPKIKGETNAATDEVAKAKGLRPL